MITWINPTDAPEDREAFSAIKKRLQGLECVSNFRIEKGYIFIATVWPVTPEKTASIDWVFDEFSLPGEFDYIIQDRNFELDKAESERKDLETQLKSRVDELLKWTDLLTKIQSVEVCWTIMTRIQRLLGKNSTKKKIKITVDDRDIIDFTTGQILLRKLEREFDLPAEIRDWRISKQSEQIFQRDPVEENPIDD